MECFVIFVVAWCWCNATESKPQNVSGNIMTTQLEQQIRKGIKATYMDIIRFNKESDSDIKPEYLVTVNIAQKVAEINDQHNPDDYPIRIRLEEKARRLLNACRVYVPATTADELFTLNYWEELVSDILPKSKQRVDIAIYDNTEKPIALIEVKKFTQYPKTLNKDIKRNLNFLGLYKQTLYKSELNTSYLVFLYNDKVSVKDSEITAKIAELKKFYEDFIISKNIDTNITATVDVYSITNSLLTGDDLTLPQEIQQYQFEKRHHYLCILIKFNR